MPLDVQSQENLAYLQKSLGPGAQLVNPAVTPVGQVTQASTAPVPNAGSTATVPPPTVITPQAAQQNLAQIKQATDNIVAGQQAQKAAQQPAPQAAPQPTQAPTGVENYYYTKTQDPTGKQIVTYYDQNGQVLPTNPIGGDQYAQNPEATPNAQGRLTQLSGAPTEGGFTQTPLTTGQYNAQILGLNQSQQQNLLALNQQSDQAFKDYQTKLAQIQSGTFPLTPQQQSILDATKAQFDTLRQQQIIANNNFVQGTQVFEARTGGITGGTQTALGNVQNAVNVGLQKLNELDSKAAQTLAQLQSGFQNDDLKLITDSWSAWQNYAAQKEKTINDIYATTSQAVKDLRDFTYNQTKDNIAATLANDKFSWQQKQDLVDNQLKQAQLDETKRANLVKEAQAQQTLNLQKQANDLIQGVYSNTKLQGIPSTTPDGNPNPVYQEQFLSTLPPQTAQLVKGIADYTINPNVVPTRQFKGMAGLTQQQVMALVQKYDPTYNQMNWQARQKFLTGWNAGGQNSVIVAANTSIDHLTKLWTQAKNLGNASSGDLGPFTSKYNSITQWLNEGAQNPNVNQFKQTALALAGEMARIYKNGIGSSAAPTDDEIRQQLGILTTNVSPQNAKGLIENGVNLMNDRLTSSIENYQSVMGKSPQSILTPTALENIKKLQDEGLNIDISKLNPSPYGSMSNSDFYSNIPSSTSTQSNTDFFNSLLQNIPQINQ